MPSAAVKSGNPCRCAQDSELGLPEHFTYNPNAQILQCKATVISLQCKFSACINHCWPIVYNEEFTVFKWCTWRSYHNFHKKNIHIKAFLLVFFNVRVNFHCEGRLSVSSFDQFVILLLWTPKNTNSPKHFFTRTNELLQCFIIFILLNNTLGIPAERQTFPQQRR